MAYDKNSNNKTLYPRTFYALYIGPNDSCTSHLIFKLSIEQILTTPKYKPVPMPYVEILTRTDRPKRLLLPEIDSNSKTSKVDFTTNIYSNISDKRM